MIALDTNVVVRFVTNDEPKQASRARKVIETDDVLIPASVLLESEWVLRAAYGFDADAIRKAFQGLMGLPTVHVESSERVAMALGWYEAGLDFADALHLASSSGADQFATFDEKLLRRAKTIRGLAVVSP